MNQKHLKCITRGLVGHAGPQTPPPDLLIQKEHCNKISCWAIGTQNSLTFEKHPFKAWRDHLHLQGWGSQASGGRETETLFIHLSIFTWWHRYPPSELLLGLYLEEKKTNTSFSSFLRKSAPNVFCSITLVSDIHRAAASSPLFPWSPDTHLRSWSRLSLLRPYSSYSYRHREPNRLDNCAVWDELKMCASSFSESRERLISWHLHANSIFENQRKITSINHSSKYSIPISTNAI